MTERKPPEVTFESWIDKQIREAEQRGDFASLPGRGKPLPEGLDTTSYDEQWWIKQKMVREGVSHLPRPWPCARRPRTCWPPRRTPRPRAWRAAS